MKTLQVVNYLLGVVCVMNDIPIFGKNIQEHDKSSGRSFKERPFWDRI